MRALLAGDAGASRELRVVATHGFPRAFVTRHRASLVFRIGEERGLFGLVAARRQSIYVSNALSDPRWVALLPSLRSAFFAPVVTEHEVGVLALYSERTDGFSLAHRQLAEAYARTLGTAQRIGARAMRASSGRSAGEIQAAHELARLVQSLPSWSDNDAVPLSRRGETERGASVAELSDRELEVVSALQRGLRPSQIGKALGISHHTARNHLKRMYRKLGVHSQVELLAAVSVRSESARARTREPEDAPQEPRSGKKPPRHKP